MQWDSKELCPPAGESLNSWVGRDLKDLLLPKVSGREDREVQQCSAPIPALGKMRVDVFLLTLLPLPPQYASLKQLTIEIAQHLLQARCTFHHIQRSSFKGGSNEEVPLCGCPQIPTRPEDSLLYNIPACQEPQALFQLLAALNT